MFIPTKKYLNFFSGTTQVELWKSKEMSEESIENINISDSNFSATFIDHHLLPDTSFNGQFVIKSNISPQ